MTEAVCINCGAVGDKRTFSHGECARCYQYRWRTGRRNPKPPPPITPSHCSNPKCGKSLENESRKYGGFCNACRLYKKRNNGKMRPKKLVNRPRYTKRNEYTHCKNTNCGKPLEFEPRPVRGWCEPCFHYFNRHGIARPREFCIGSGVIGWCDCGNAARYEEPIKLTMFGQKGAREKSETLLLCQRCYEDFL